MVSPARVLGSLLCLVLAGCVLDEVSLEGRGCPCAAGWVCDEGRNVCIRRAPGDGGALDGAARDARLVDAPGTDARGRDAGPFDAAGVDGSRADAGLPPVDERVHRRSIGAAGVLLTTMGTVEAGERHLVLADAPGPRIGAGDRVRLGDGSSAGEAFVQAILADGSIALERPVARDHDGPVTIERAYATMPAWESAREGDLVGEDRIEIGLAWDDAVFTEPLVIDGSTTDAAHYIELTAAPGARHTGRAGTGVVVAPAVAAHGIAILDPHTRVSWLEVTRWSVGVAMSLDGINIAADGVLVDSVIVHDDGSDGTMNPDCNAITLEANSVTATVRNSVVYRLARAGVVVHGVAGSTLRAENVTGYDCTRNDPAGAGYGCFGVTGSSTDSTLIAVNCIGIAAATRFAFQTSSSAIRPGWGESSNNLSNDDTAPGPDAVLNVAAADLFVSTAVGAEDFHLVAGADAIDRGANLGVSFTTDVDGDERSGAWDIGADER